MIANQTVRNAQMQSAITRQLADIDRNTQKPPTVSVQNNIPPAQIIMGDEAEKARRKLIREQLGKLITEGDSIANSCAQGAACKAARRRWESKVESYLRSNLDSSFMIRFKFNEGSMLPNETKQIGEDQSTLIGFLDDLKD
ncbi:MAG TPA: hypothetical protein VMX16_17615 [Terriglobia bacterium]|nr:hypothetical protein [Terriglobia bacterium]